MTNKFPYTLIQCFAAIAQHHGLQVDPEQLINEYALADEETSSSVLLEIAVNIGFKAKLEQLSWQSLLDKHNVFPLMVRLNNGNGVIVVGVHAEDGGQVLILDPLCNFPIVQICSYDLFCTQWTGDVFFFFMEKDTIHKEDIQSQLALDEVLGGHSSAVDEMLLKENLKIKEAMVPNMKQEYTNQLLSDKETTDCILGFLLNNKTKLFKHPEVRSFVSQRVMENKIANDEIKIIESLSAKQATSSYNLDSLKNLLGFDRGGKLVDVFMSLFGDLLNENAKYLCIGPRNEAELYAIISYGIGPENIFALDLISSDPFVISGDMHRMPFPSNSFDTIFIGWVLSYSNDLEQACSEIIRVAKDGAYIVIGNDYNANQDVGNQFFGGYVFKSAEDIFELFSTVISERIISRNPHAPYDHNSRKIIAGFVLNKGCVSDFNLQPDQNKEVVNFDKQRCNNLQAEIDKTKYLESNAVRDFFHNLPIDLQNNAQMKIRFESHSNRLLEFSEKTEGLIDNAYLIMRQQYALHGNVIDQAISAQISKTFPRSDVKLMPFQSIFSYNETHIETALKDISEDGYHFCPFKLNAKQIVEILKYFENNEEPGFALKFQVPLINNELGLNLFMDRYFIELASRYLDTVPILNSITGFDTNAGTLSEEQQSEYAMKFHFDKDWISWFNVFIYLDDVSVDNGPHCFVPGSHRNRGNHLLRDGRFSDEEIKLYYGSDAIKTITGEAGTIFIANTHALHRGSVVNQGKRRILQLIYSNSLFGAHQSQYKMNLLDEAHSAKLEPIIYGNPRLFQNFRLCSEIS